MAAYGSFKRVRVAIRTTKGLCFIGLYAHTHFKRSFKRVV
jgi:hypothetical protein